MEIFKYDTRVGFSETNGVPSFIALHYSGAFHWEWRQLVLWLPRFRSRLLWYVLPLFVLTSFSTAGHAQPKFLPSEEYPGPWREVTQEIRDFLTLQQIAACGQAAGRESSRNPGEYLLYCTDNGKIWTSWRIKPVANKVRGPGKLLEGIAPPDGY